MGGGGGNLSQLGGNYGGYGGNFGSYADQSLKPYGNYGGGNPAGTGTDAQRNFINAHGALPPGMGGGALNQGQQNFFQNKGYLPPGFTGGTNMGFLSGAGGGQTGGNQGGGHQYGEPPGSYNAQGGGGWDISQAFQHLFGGGTNFGPYTNWMQ